MKGIFVAPSGNMAKITITTVGNRSACDIAWRNCPPSDEDMRAAEAAAADLLESETGRPTVAVDSEYTEDEERMRRMRREKREFLGGGRG